MSLVSSNPQDLAQEINDYLAEGWTCPPDAKRMLTAASKLLVTPQASSAEHDKEELIERIAAELADYRLNIGPKTRDLIASGSWKQMPLSVSERRDIAELAATEALKPREAS